MTALEWNTALVFRCINNYLRRIMLTYVNPNFTYGVLVCVKRLLDSWCCPTHLEVVVSKPTMRNFFSRMANQSHYTSLKIIVNLYRRKCQTS